jgi:hypothetical protein
MKLLPVDNNGRVGSRSGWSSDRFNISITMVEVEQLTPASVVTNVADFVNLEP